VSAWSPDGQTLLFIESREADQDILGLSTAANSQPAPVVRTRFNEAYPEFSPDGRWLAYASDESGTNEVYVRPFPGPGGRWQVSNGGGVQPVWSRDGRELFYLSLDSRMMVAEVRETPAFSVAELRRLFDATGFVRDAFHQSYDLTPDARSFIFLNPAQPADGSQSQVVEVDNWLADVRARLR
jgi:hypothetical protein